MGEVLHRGKMQVVLPVTLVPRRPAGIGAQVPSVKPPVLVLWGRHDKILPPETALKFAEALPDATVTYLERSGHSGHLEEPAATAAAILHFAAAIVGTQQ